jgi:phage N-6-adenine-methyltransferase
VTLVGFKAQNHPQQTTRPDFDNRSITDADFAPLQKRFRFSIDAAASQDNAKLPRFWTVDDDALSQSWVSERVWCNPPYSNIRPWIEKAWTHRGVTKRAELIVMLLPANRTEQAWWQDLVEPSLRDRFPVTFRCEFLRGRMRFDRPDAVIGPKGDRPPFGCCLLIWGA